MVKHSKNLDMAGAFDDRRKNRQIWKNNKIKKRPGTREHVTSVYMPIVKSYNSC
jgi:hypothetical protein